MVPYAHSWKPQMLASAGQIHVDAGYHHSLKVEDGKGMVCAISPPYLDVSCFSQALSFWVFCLGGSMQLLLSQTHSGCKSM